MALTSSKILWECKREKKRKERERKERERKEREEREVEEPSTRKKCKNKNKKKKKEKKIDRLREKRTKKRKKIWKKTWKKIERRLKEERSGTEGTKMKRKMKKRMKMKRQKEARGWGGFAGDFFSHTQEGNKSPKSKKCPQVSFIESTEKERVKVRLKKLKKLMKACAWLEKGTSQSQLSEQTNSFFEKSPSPLSGFCWLAGDLPWCRVKDGGSLFLACLRSEEGFRCIFIIFFELERIFESWLEVLEEHGEEGEAENDQAGRWGRERSGWKARASTPLRCKSCCWFTRGERRRSLQSFHSIWKFKSFQSFSLNLNRISFKNFTTSQSYISSFLFWLRRIWVSAHLGPTEFGTTTTLLIVPAPQVTCWLPHHLK